MINNIKKICLIGDAGVGKSALMYRYMHKKFTGEYTHTIGVDFNLKSENTTKGSVKISLWDISGDNQYNKVIEPHFINARFNILMFDVTDRNTFANLPSWLSRINELGNDDIPTVLVGCKVDMPNRQVLKEEAEYFCTKHNLFAYTDISNKTGKNIKELFSIIVQSIIENDDIVQLDYGEKIDSPLLGSTPTNVNCSKCCLIM